MRLEQDERLEDLLIGGLKIVQSEKLYKFTSDAVLLSRFAPKTDGRVADLCSGSGIVGLHYYALSGGADVDCYELQTSLHRLCEKSVEYNGLVGRITAYNMPVQEIPADKNGAYSLALCNPPYKKADSGIKNADDHIAVCRHEICVTLGDIAAVASRILKRGGKFCLCQRVERLADAIEEMRGHNIEPSRLQFVSSSGKKPYLFLLEGVKGIKRKFEVLPQINNGEE